MVDVDFEFIIEGQAEDGPPLLDTYEVNMLLDHTREQVCADLQRKLAGLVCDEHGQPPRIRVSATYDAGTEQMDLQYHIDTCCKLFLLRVVKTLNHRP